MDKKILMLVKLNIVMYLVAFFLAVCFFDDLSIQSEQTIAKKALAKEAMAKNFAKMKDFALTTAEEVKNLASKSFQSALSSEAFQNTTDQVTKYYEMMSSFTDSLMDKVSQNAKAQ